jgi:hypothetical protein
VGELTFDLVNNLPARIQLSPDEQTLFAGSNRSWLVDLNEKAAPVKILDHPSNTQKALFSSDGDTLVTMQMNLDVDVWKKRRELSSLGALIHWEYWAVYLVCLVGLAGMTVQMTRQSGKWHGFPVPIAVWIVALATAIGLGAHLGDLLLDRVLNQVWGENRPASVGRLIWQSIIGLLWLRILVGLVRLEPFWRKIALAVLMLGMILLLGLIIWFFSDQITAPEAMVDGPFHRDLTFSNGWKPGWSARPYLFGISLIIVFQAGCWWGLFRSASQVASTRNAPAP